MIDLSDKWLNDWLVAVWDGCNKWLDVHFSIDFTIPKWILIIILIEYHELVAYPLHDTVYVSISFTCCINEQWFSRESVLQNEWSLWTHSTES